MSPTMAVAAKSHALITGATKWWESRQFERRRSQGRFLPDFNLDELPGVEHFVGREEELEAIHSALQMSTESPPRVEICGPAGFGKTQLAIAYIKKFHADCSVVIWLDATNETTLQQSYAKVARRVGHYDALDMHVRLMVGRVVGWLQEPQNKNWILVLDNYGGPSQGDSPAPWEISFYFPKSKHGAIITTIQDSNEPPGHVRLKKLGNRNHGIRILEFASNRQNLELDPDALLLVKKLDGLPLALATAGAVLQHAKISCEEYLTYYNSAWDSLRQRLPGILISDDDRTMYAAWIVSDGRVEAKSPTAAKLLWLWPYFAKDDLCYELIFYMLESSPQLRGITRSDFDEAMNLLIQYGFAKRTPAHGDYSSTGYSLHGSAHSWASNFLTGKLDSSLSRKALVCIALNVLDRGEKHFKPEMRLAHHAKHCTIAEIQILLDDETQTHPGPSIKALSLLIELFRLQDHGKAAGMLRIAVIKCHARTMSPDHFWKQDYLKILEALCSYHALSIEANRAIGEVSEICGDAGRHGPRPLYTSEMRRDLSKAYKVQGKSEQARMMSERNES